MFRPVFATSFVCLGAASLLIVPPAAAQSLGAKDAWDVLASFLGGTGGRLTSSGLLREGEALVARDARVSFADLLEVRIPELRLDPQGDMVAITPSARFEVVSRIGAPGERRDYVISHDGGFRLMADPLLARLDLDFGRLEFQKAAATRNGQPLDEALRIVATGLTGRLGLGLAEPHSVSIELGVAQMDQEVAVNDPSLMLAQAVQTQARDIRIELTAEGIRAFDTRPGWLGRAFAEGLGARLVAINGETTGSIDQTIAGMQMATQISLASSVTRASLADGMVALDQVAQDFRLPMTVMGIPIDASLSRLEIELAAPLVVLPEERDFVFRFGLHDLTVDEPLLAMIGAQQFAGEPASVEVDLRGSGRWLVEITEDPEPRDMPLDVTGLDLRRLLLALGAAQLTGEGRFAMAPGAMARAGDGPPDGEGDFIFELRGGSALLGRLAAAGLIPPDQQFMAQMMMGALGRSVGEDHLRSELAIRPGGRLTVNGMPLPF